MTTNGLLYTDRRVLVALAVLTRDRDQDSRSITQKEIAAEALVSPRTGQVCLNRLQEAGLIAMIGGGRGCPYLYLITDEGEKILEAYR